MDKKASIRLAGDIVRLAGIAMLVVGVPFCILDVIRTPQGSDTSHIFRFWIGSFSVAALFCGLGGLLRGGPRHLSKPTFVVVILSSLFPRNDREFVRGDLEELTEELRAAGASKWVIIAVLIWQVICSLPSIAWKRLCTIAVGAGAILWRLIS